MAGVLSTLITINGSTLQGADLKFRIHAVNSNSTYEACAVIDVNQDGKLDIVSGGLWYAAPDWKSYWVRDVEKLGDPPEFDGYSHLELDVNRDGLMDMVVANWRSRSLYWLEHPNLAAIQAVVRQAPSMNGQQGSLEIFGKVIKKSSIQSAEWVKHTIAEPGSMETARLYDINGDGRLDVLPNGSDFAAWWKLLPGSPGQPSKWERYDLPQLAAGHGIGFGDINGDGRGDIVVPRGWLEAPTERRSTNWAWHAEFDLTRVSIPIIVADVEGDGDMDLVYAIGHAYGVYWQEQIQTNGRRSWKKHLIDESWSVGHSPLWIDMDQNGTFEFVNGKRYRAHQFKDPGALDPQVLYRYEYDRSAGKWNRYDIQPPGGPAGIGLDPRAVDLDADGDLDLVLPGRSGLYWCENLLK